MRLVRLVACLASAPLALGTAAVASAAPADPTVYVTVHLASEARAVATLAGTPALSRTSRLDMLRSAVARPEVRRGVSSFLATRGFTLHRSSPFVVRAEAPRSVVNAVFPRDHATGLRSHGPLGGAASYVVASTDGAGLLRPLAARPLSGAEVRGLYDAPSGTPPTGRVSPKIATLQFSGWDSGDLTTFAVRNGLPDPLSNGRYREVSVDGANPRTPDGFDGEFEVALDQEALLATAPNAGQVAYFAPNSIGAMIDAVEQVATDAYNGSNIGALSISYGLCEPDMPPAAIDAMHQAFADALSVGVTVFAASGDDGAFGCADSRTAVIYPASDPYVVGVGGTTVDMGVIPATETVWWDGMSGSGGGTSAVFSEPSFQTGVAPGLPGRGVPDISVAGDPNSGLVIVVNGLTGSVGGTSLSSPFAAGTFTDLLASNGREYGVGDIHRNLYAAPATAFRDITSGDNGQYSAGPGYDLASGLGAPLWGALHDAVLSTPTVKSPTYSNTRTVKVNVSTPSGVTYTGWSIGVGVPPANCGRPATTTPPTSVRAPADGTAEIYVIGFTDTGFCSASRTRTRVDTVAPVADARGALSSTNRRTVYFAWRADDHSPSSGLRSYRVRIYKAGSTKSVYRDKSTTRKHFTLRHATRGATYIIRVSALDMARNRGGVTSTKVRIP